VTAIEEVATGWVEANQRYLVAALAVLGQRIRAKEGGAIDEQAAPRQDEVRLAMAVPPALDRVAAVFGLSDFERDVLLLCAGVELDAAFAHACAAAQGDAERTYATFSLAMAALADSHWSALNPAAPLRRWHLVELAHPEVPTTCPLRIDERVLHALAGLSYLDPRLATMAETVSQPIALPSHLRQAASQVAASWSSLPGSSGVHLHGRQRPDLRAVGAAACSLSGLRPVCLRAADLPGAPADRELLARLCERESALERTAWILDVDDHVPGSGRLALDLASRIQAPVVVVSREQVAGSSELLRQVPVSPTGASDARVLWRTALGASAALLDGWLDRVAGQFDLDLASVEAAVGMVRPLLDAADCPEPDDLGARLWDACRQQARPALDDLTQRIEPRATWEDLVLPAPQTRILREIAVHVKHRLRVLEDWGFAARTGRGLGIAALFAGPSGTGKTLAAEVLAGALALDLYRVDLSQVVSKYIGETEKNLRRIFDAAEAGGAVLLFDEADALFGKRSEVKDSHDRYANIEVSYLLQRMETYRGLAILTTNLKSALDTAFLRRLRFVVQFPFPDAALRAEIWRRVFPAQAPTESLDPAKLARLTVAGGTIRNIALSAAFLAADASVPVRMEHILRAARTEYAKLERPLTDAEVAEWTT